MIVGTKYVWLTAYKRFDKEPLTPMPQCNVDVNSKDLKSVKLVDSFNIDCDIK